MREPGAAEDPGSRPVTRRRFLAGTGASALAVGLAGCPEISGNGDRAEGTTGTARTEGETTGTTAGNDDQATVRWGFDPLAVAENGEAITQALYDNGLSDDVEVQLVAGDEDIAQRRADYNRVLEAEESTPDMFLMEHGWVNIFLQRERIQNLSDLFSDQTASTIDDEYFDGVTASARAPETGDLFGVPVFAQFPTMQYRVDLVEQAGYSPMENDWATEPMTWQEWSHVTADVYDSSDVEFGFTTQWDIYEGTACCTFNEVLSSWGGAYFGGRENLFGPVGDRPITVDAEPVVNSLQMMRKFVHDEDVERLGNYAGGFTPRDVLGWIETDSRPQFASGNAVMHRDWSESLASLGRETDTGGDPSLGENLGTMPIPYAVPEDEAQAQGAGGTTAALGGWHATVNPNSENQAAVAAVLEAAMEPDFQLKLFSLQRWLPPRPALFDTTEARNVDVVGRYLDALRVAGENVLSHPATPVWNDQASVIAQEANRAVAQELPADEAMTELKASLEEIEEAS